MRRRARSTLLTAIVAVAVSLVLTVPAMGQDDHEDEGVTTTTPTTLPGAVGIGDNLSFVGGEVLDSSGETVRTFDAKQAAVFVQSWIGMVFADPPPADPPADAPVYLVRINGTWVSDNGYQTIYYAESGDQAWISWPQSQERATTASTTAPPPEVWFQAPPKALEAFQGRGDLAQTAGVYTATSIPGQRTPDAPSESESESRDWILWVMIAVAAAVLLVAGGLLLRSRRAQPEPAARR
jgi:hypothetical protein